MEIVLLWLDDLDDLFFAAIMLWRRIARRMLGVGFAAAVVLAITCIADVYTVWLTELTVIAAGSVVAWSVAALPIRLGARRQHSLPA
jgi:hypothetical protein